MKAKHTPGPWTPTHCDVSGYELPRSVYADTIPIASIAGQAKGGPAEWIANARLIAAAPDLLAALQRVRRLPMWGDNGTVRAQVDAALALAELETVPGAEK